jgi:hypothetical protein
MHDEGLQVGVSLRGLRRRIEALMLSDDVNGAAQPRPRRPPGARPAPSEDHRPIRRSRSRVPVIRPAPSRNVVVPRRAGTGARAP